MVIKLLQDINFQNEIPVDSLFIQIIYIFFNNLVMICARIIRAVDFLHHIVFTHNSKCEAFPTLLELKKIKIPKKWGLNCPNL